MKATVFFYLSIIALLLLFMSSHAYAEQSLSFVTQGTEGVYVLRAENITGQIDSVGARLDLPDQAQVTNVELTGLLVGGFLSWIQQEDKLFIVAAPPENQIPIEDTDLANIYITFAEGTSITDVTIEESNKVGWDGSLIIVMPNSSPTATEESTTLYLPITIQ